MSLRDAGNLIRRMDGDEVFRRAFYACNTREEAMAFAREEGFLFTLNEFKKARVLLMPRIFDLFESPCPSFH